MDEDEDLTHLERAGKMAIDVLKRNFGRQAAVIAAYALRQMLREDHEHSDRIWKILKDD